MEGNVRVGLIGLGEISLIHEAGYQESGAAQLVAFCDVDIERARERAEPYGAKYYDDYEKLLEDEEVETVDIMLPHYLHYKVAKEALLAGKHVVVEKPVTMKYQEAMDLIRTAKSMGLRFFVAENTRYVKAYQEILQVLRSGELGNVYYVRTLIAGSEVARYSDTGSWIRQKSRSGGIVLDAGVHTFYLFRWFFGGIKEIKDAFSWHLLGADAEDNAVIIGELSNGAFFVSQFSDTSELPWTERLEVYSRNGVLLVDQLVNPPAKVYHGTMDEEGRVLGVEYDPVGWKARSIIEEIKDFVGAIVEKRDSLADPEDAAYAVKDVEEVQSKLSVREHI